MRDGSAPNMARWIADDGYHLAEWETDLSSQTGASQAGILLGSNENIPAFRWVEKENGRMLVCSSPADCAEIEGRHATGIGLLIDGGASRGNLLSGEAEDGDPHRQPHGRGEQANPGYRAFLANGFNVTRALVLFFWEVVIEMTAALRAARRDVRPRGHRGGIYPFMRAAMCVIVRDLIVFGVLTDMMRGRPAVYATFSSYDEVAHHSGLERADTLEALRKLDQQFGRIERARRYAPRPYEIVVLSDHGQTQGATFKQRNGYGLDELVERSLDGGEVTAFAGGDEQQRDGRPRGRRGRPGARPRRSAEERRLGSRRRSCSGPATSASIYLMEAPHRLTLEEIDERHPELIRRLRAHPHIGWLLVRSAEHGAVVLGADGAHYLDEGRVEGDDPLAAFSPTAPAHLLRTDGFAHVADIMVGSFYDPELDEGCAFEELICFHGGLGGPQTRPFILHPPHLDVPDEPIIGAAAVHGLLVGWRRSLADAEAPPAVAAAEGRPRRRQGRVRLVEETGGARAVDRLGARGDPELAVDRSRLGLDRVRGDEEVVGDLAERQVGGEEVEQPELGGAQRPATHHGAGGVDLLPRPLDPLADDDGVVGWPQVARGLRELGSRARHVVEQEQRSGDHDPDLRFVPGGHRRSNRTSARSPCAGPRSRPGFGRRAP